MLFRSAFVLINASRRKKLQNLWIQETVGLMFRGFEENYIFWDSMILLRKALLVTIVVHAYSLGGNLQGLLALCVLVFSLFLQTSLLPFKSKFGYLNQVESMSLFVSSITFLCGVILSDSRMTSSFVEVSLLILVVVGNVGLAAFLFYYLFRVKVQQIKFSLLANGIGLESDNAFCILRIYSFMLFGKIIDVSLRSFRETFRKDPVGTASSEELDNDV